MMSKIPSNVSNVNPGFRKQCPIISTICVNCENATALFGVEFGLSFASHANGRPSLIISITSLSFIRNLVVYFFNQSIIFFRCCFCFFTVYLIIVIIPQPINIIFTINIHPYTSFINYNNVNVFTQYGTTNTTFK